MITQTVPNWNATKSITEQLEVIMRIAIVTYYYYKDIFGGELQLILSGGGCALMVELSADGQAQGKEVKQILPGNLIWALKEDGPEGEEGWLGMDCDLQ